MLGFLFAVVKKFQGNGIKALTLLVQTVMYNEAITVTGVDYRSMMYEVPMLKLQQWLWFVTAQVATSIKYLFPGNDELFNLIAYSLSMLSLMGAITTMTCMKDDSVANYDVVTPAGLKYFLDLFGTGSFSLLYVVFMASFWILTVDQFGMGWVLFPASLVVVNDTMAYVFGRLMGKTKLLPKLSPKKTLEGFVGAAISTIALSVPLARLFIDDSSSSYDNNIHIWLLAAYVSIVSPYGGFLASAVKRSFGAKDFGNFIPGHGGAIDRLDCQVITAPFVYLILKYVHL